MQRIIFNERCPVTSQLLEKCVLIKGNVVQALVAKRASLQAFGLHKSRHVRSHFYCGYLIARCLLLLLPYFSFTLLNLLCALAEIDPWVALPSVSLRGSPDGLT